MLINISHCIHQHKVLPAAHPLLNLLHAYNPLIPPQTQTKPNPPITTQTQRSPTTKLHALLCHNHHAPAPC
jgi:hypothetical protein